LWRTRGGAYDGPEMRHLRIPGLVLVVACQLVAAACGGAPHQPVQPNDRAACEVDIAIANTPCEANCPLVEQALADIDGIKGVRMDFATHTAYVQAEHPACGGKGFDEMIAALDDAGFDASIESTR
jgi:hypothetical protein